MNKTAKTFLTVLSLSLLVCIVGAGLLIYCYNCEYDAIIDHFTADSPVVYCMTAVLALGIVIACIGNFVAGKNAWIDTANEKTSFAETFTGILAALLAALNALLIMNLGMPEDKPYATCIYIAFLFATTVFFFVKAFAEKAKKKRPFGLINFFPCIMLVSNIVRSYFDKSHALNSAYYTLHILMLITFLLNFAFECGVEVDSPCCTKKYLFGAASAISAGGAVVIAEIVVSVMSGVGFTMSLLESVFYLVVWFFILVRFARRSTIAQIKENQIVKKDKKKKNDVDEADKEVSEDEAIAESTEESSDEPEADNNTEE